MEAIYNMFNEIKHEKYGKYKLVGIFGFLFLSLVFFYSFIYNDIIETMRMGIDVWYSLFDGELNYFYARRTEVNAIAYPKTVQGVYDFPIYIVFALWNFPLWIAENFFSVDVFRSPLCLMWGKTLILVASILITKAIYDLAKTLGMDKKTRMFVCALFVTSNFFMISIIMMCAYDILSLYFVIVGINYYLKGDMKRFTLCFMCAIPLKFFALLIYIPLVILKEKRIPQIIGYVFASILPILLCRLFIPCRAVFEDPSSASLSILNVAKSTELSNLAWIYTILYDWETSLGSIYLSLAMFGILYLFCYFYKPETDEEIKKWSIYICFLTFANLFITCMTHPYWIMILLPFIVLIMGMNRKYIYANMVLETVMTLGLILAQIFKFPWCFGSALVAGMFWPSILGKKVTFEDYTVMNILQELGLEGASKYGIGMGCTIFFGCILVFAVLNFPGWKKELPIVKDMSITWIVVARVLAGFVIALFPIGMYMVSLSV